MDGGIEDALYVGSVLQDPNGNRNVPYLNWNGNRWYLNFDKKQQS